MDRNRPIKMDQCVKLSGKTIMYMNWSPKTPLLYIAKVQNGKTLMKTWTIWPDWLGHDQVHLHLILYHGLTNLAIVILQRVIKQQVNQIHIFKVPCVSTFRLWKFCSITDLGHLPSPYSDWDWDSSIPGSALILGISCSIPEFSKLLLCL